MSRESELLLLEFLVVALTIIAVVAMAATV